MAVKACKEFGKDIGKSLQKCIHCGSVQGMNTFLKIVLAFFGAIIFFSFIHALNSPRSNITSNDPITMANNIIDDNNTTMNKSEFDQIQTGMTYEQVVEITGCQGTVEAESGATGTELHTISYGWKGHGSIGANASTMFQGGKLINKAQLGLN